MEETESIIVSIAKDSINIEEFTVKLLSKTGREIETGEGGNFWFIVGTILHKHAFYHLALQAWKKSSILQCYFWDLV